eukprot:4717650-Amphidinium_carterae.1
MVTTWYTTQLHVVMDATIHAFSAAQRHVKGWGVTLRRTKDAGHGIDVYVRVSDHTVLLGACSMRNRREAKSCLKRFESLLGRWRVRGAR